MTDHALNARLHELLGVGAPCATACTHVVVGTWTALGLANVAGRAAPSDGRYTFEIDPPRRDDAYPPCTCESVLSRPGPGPQHSPVCPRHRKATP